MKRPDFCSAVRAIHPRRVQPRIIAQGAARPSISNPEARATAKFLIRTATTIRPTTALIQLGVSVSGATNSHEPRGPFVFDTRRVSHILLCEANTAHIQCRTMVLSAQRCSPIASGVCPLLATIRGGGTHTLLIESIRFTSLTQFLPSNTEVVLISCFVMARLVIGK
jgi:hypothetical protein